MFLWCCTCVARRECVSPPQDTVIYDRLSDSARYREITLKHLEQFATEGEWGNSAPCRPEMKTTFGSFIFYLIGMRHMYRLTPQKHNGLILHRLHFGSISVVLSLFLTSELNQRFEIEHTGVFCRTGCLTVSTSSKRNCVDSLCTSLSPFVVIWVTLPSCGRPVQ